jgi:hypothetical protein
MKEFIIERFGSDQNRNTRQVSQNLPGIYTHKKKDRELFSSP